VIPDYASISGKLLGIDYLI